MKCKGTSKGCLLCMDSIIGKNFTVDTFWKSTILIANWCCMCKNSGESIEQHLLNFSVPREIFNAMNSDLVIMFLERELSLQ